MASAGDRARAGHDKVLDLFRAYDGQHDDDGMTDLVESICQELVQPPESEPSPPAVADVPPTAPRSAGLDANLLTGEAPQRIPH